MKFYVYPTLAAGLLIIGGCKSPLFESALNMHKPAAETRQSSPESDWNSGEKIRRTSHDEFGSIRPASFETLAEEHRQQSSPPGRVAIEDYLKRGHIAGRQGRLEEAKKFYDLVLRTDPDNMTAHHRLGVIADKQQNFQAAERHYQKAYRQQPYDSDLLADIGYSYFLQKRFEDSEQYLSKALQSNPSHLRTLNNLGLLYGTMGDYDRALVMLRRTGSESEAREKLAKFFPRAKSRMQTSENNPENAMFSSRGDTWNGSPVSAPFSTGSELSNPLASRELSAPNPRGAASRNSRVRDPRSDQFMNGRGTPSALQNNFDSSRTAGNSGNSFWPAGAPVVVPRLPADTYGGSPGGINLYWPQSETQPPGATRPQPNQIMPEQYQPLSTFPQPIPTDVRPVQEWAAAPNRLLPAPVHTEGLSQVPYDGLTKFGNQNRYQGTPTSGSRNEPVKQVNPLHNGFPEYGNQQPDINGANPTRGPSPRTNSVWPEDARRASLPGMNAGPGVMLPAIDSSSTSAAQHYSNPNPNDSISNPSTQSPAFNQSGTTRSQPWRGDRYSPQPASAYSDFGFQFQQRQTGNGLTAGDPNPTGNQSEAFRLYEQRRRRQNASAKTVQQFPQTVPQQQPGFAPAWPQDSQQFPSSRIPRIPLGRQPRPQGMANPSRLR